MLTEEQPLQQNNDLKEDASLKQVSACLLAIYAHTPPSSDGDKKLEQPLKELWENSHSVASTSSTLVGKFFDSITDNISYWRIKFLKPTPESECKDIITNHTNLQNITVPQIAGWMIERLRKRNKPDDGSAENVEIKITKKLQTVIEASKKSQP